MIKKTPATIVDGVAVPAEEEVIQRAYTPTSQPNALGEIELLLKLYLPTPTIPGGKMTT
jgi:nitrate reductase (NAD(P)H)